MKVAFGSDFHLEFGDRDFHLPDADVLVMAGDILCVNDLKFENEYTVKGSSARKFLRDISEKYKNIVYVGGNHEAYDGNINQLDKIVKDCLKSENISNIDFCSKGTFVIDDVTFICATLWTDIKKGNHVVVRANIMSDYKYTHITDADGHERNLDPYDTIAIHKEHKDYLDEQLNLHPGKVVVVTHHAPSMMSSLEESHSITDFYYCCTDCDDTILDNTNIKYWIHGHLHTRHEYMIGDTTVISNCRGYHKIEAATKTFKIKILEL